MSIRLSASVLPVSRGLEFGQRLLVPLKQIRDPVEQRGTVGDACGRPFAVVEGLSRGGDRVARIVGGGLVDHRGDTAIGWVDDLASPAIGRVTPLPADQEIGFTVHLPLTSFCGAAYQAPSGAETGHYPLVELRDVMFGRYEHTTLAVGAGGHRGLSSLARLEVLLVDPVEQLDRV